MTDAERQKKIVARCRSVVVDLMQEDLQRAKTMVDALRREHRTARRKRRTVELRRWEAELVLARTTIDLDRARIALARSEAFVERLAVRRQRELAKATALRDRVEVDAPTARKVSRQALWQRKQREKGLCVLCSEKAYKGWRCPKHYEQHKITMRLRYEPKARGRYNTKRDRGAAKEKS